MLSAGVGDVVTNTSDTDPCLCVLCDMTVCVRASSGMAPLCSALVFLLSSALPGLVRPPLWFYQRE
jgi:hypothetical protein